jgi:PAS domain S-box-containing protein
MDLLCSIAQEMSIRRSPSFLLNQIIGQVAAVMRVEAASLLLLNEETDFLDFVVVKGLNAQALRELDMRLRPKEGLAGWVFSHNKPAVVNSPDDDPRFQPGADWLTGFKTRNLLVAPLRLNGKPFGVLELVNRRKNDSFTDEDADLASAIAALLTTTLDNVRAMKSLEKSQVMLRSLFEHAGEGIIAVDRQGLVTHVNVLASELFAWPSPPVGRPMAEAFAASPELEQFVTQVLMEEKPVIRRVFSMAFQGNVRRQVQGTIFPLSVPGQVLLGAGVLLSETIKRNQ